MLVKQKLLNIHLIQKFWSIHQDPDIARFIRLEIANFVVARDLDFDNLAEFLNGQIESVENYQS